MTKKAPLIFFDFDHTLLDVNSDVEIQKLLPGGKASQDLEAINKDKGWNEFIRQILRRLHENQVSKDEIVKLLRDMPLTEGVPAMLSDLKKIGSTFVIVSDANEIFIREPLDNANLFELFEKVVTNPAKFDQEGRLNMSPFTEQTNCKLCRTNMCKGDVLSRYIESLSSHCTNGNVTPFSFVAYVGDGPNDFCPMLKLGTSDLAFPRQGYSIEKLIDIKSKEGLNIQAKVISWSKIETITEAIVARQTEEL